MPTTITWTGSSSDDWTTASNWSPATVPVEGDNIVIPAGLTNEPTIQNGQTGTLFGTVTDNGVISLAATTSLTNLVIGGATGDTVTLQGSGTVSLGDNPDNRIYSNNSGVTLDNELTIQGAGQIIANSGLSVNNQASGVIDASFADNNLRINGISIANEGVIESTASSATVNIGGLLIEGNAVITQTSGQSGQSGGGTLEANGGNVWLDGATIVGGTLSTPNGLIEVTGGTNVLDGSQSNAPVNIDGAVQVNNGQSLQLSTSFSANATVNIGASDGISLDASGSFTNLIIASATGGTVTLQGAGTVTLSDNVDNRIYSNNSGVTLDNELTIQGAGQIIPNSGLSINNQTTGVIDANDPVALSISAPLTNEGLLEATAGGTLSLSATVDNTDGGADNSGRIVAGSAGEAGPSQVDLNGAHVIGGTLATVNSADLIEVTGASQLDGTKPGDAVSIASGSTVQVNNGQSLTLTGTSTAPGVVDIGSAGEIYLDASGSNTNLIVGSATGGTVTLQGAGTVTLSDNADNRIYSNNSGVTLNNEVTIRGAGQIFANSGLGVNNEASGVIDASFADNALQLSGISIANEGVIESTASSATVNTGGLLLEGGAVITQTSGQSGQSGGGTLEANGGNVWLDGATIVGGTLATPNGLIEVTGGTDVLDGSKSNAPVNIDGVVQINNGQSLQLSTSFSASATVNIGASDKISLDAGGASPGDTNLIVGSATGGTVTLQGAGTVTLSDNADNRIYSNNSGVTLDNELTIQGAGLITASSGLSINNEAAGGVIDADATNNALAIDAIAIANEGLIESTGAGGLLVEGGATINQTSGQSGQTGGGLIEANGGNVLLDGATIVGGTLATPNGLIEVTGGTDVLDGSKSNAPVNIDGVVQINNGQSLQLSTSFSASATINVGASDEISLDAGGASPGDTNLIVGSATGGTVTLQGAGTVTLSDNADNRIYSNNSGVTLDNELTIQGAGLITASSGLSINNEAAGGVIDADATNNALAIDAIAVANEGLIESTGAGGLLVEGGATINQTGGQSGQTGGGLIEANGGNVLLDGATIVGGTLATPNGLIEVTGGSDYLDGSTSGAPVNIAGAVQIENGQSLELVTPAGAGATINIGASDELSLDASGSDTNLIIGSATGGTVTLQGAGTVTLSDSADNRIYSNNGNVTLDNDATIQGAGQIFANSGLSLVNEAQGAVVATYANAALTISGMTVTNDGLLAAENGATLDLSSDNLTNLSVTGELTGGTYEVDDAPSGEGGSIVISGGDAAPISTLDATVDLSGAAAKLTSGGIELDDSLSSIAQNGVLNLSYGFASHTQAVFDVPANVYNSAVPQPPNPVTIAGKLNLTGAEFEAGQITIESGGSITGAGTFDGSTAENALLNITPTAIYTPEYNPITGQVSYEISYGYLNITNDGSIIDAGSLSNGQEPKFVIDGNIVTGAGQTGQIEITGDSILELMEGSDAGQTVTFANSETTGLEQLQLDTGSISATGSFESTIAGFKAGDAIDLTNLANATGYTFLNGVLTVTFASGPSASFSMTGVGTDTPFSLTSFGTDGTQITTTISESLADDTSKGSMVTSNPALTGDADAGATIYFYEGATLLGSTTANATTGAWSFTPTGLADGSQTVTAEEKNAAGDVTASTNLTFTLATQAPTASAMESVSGVTTQTSDTITVNATAENVPGDSIASVEILDNNVAIGAATLSSGVWSFTANNLTGSNVFSALVTDTAGNQTTTPGLPADIVVLAPPPPPAITSATYGETGSETTVQWNLTGTGTAGETITVYDGATKLGTTLVAANGTWTFATGETEAAVRKFTATATANGLTGAASAAYIEGTPGNDTFSFASESALDAPASINGQGGTDTLALTAPATLADADFANVTNVQYLSLTGASSVTLGADALAAGLSKVIAGSGNTGITDGNSGTLTVNATPLLATSTLTLSSGAGTEGFTVNFLVGSLNGGAVDGALAVTLGATSASSITVGSGANSITATSMTSGGTLTLAGSGNVTLVDTGSGALNVNASALAPTSTLTLTSGAGTESFVVTGLESNLVATAVKGGLNVTTSSDSLSIATGSGTNLINAGALALGDTLTLTGSNAATISALGGNLNAAGDSGGLTITATGGGAQTLTTGSASASITDNTAGSSLTVNAATLSAANTLTIAGSAPETVNNLVATLNATGETGALNVMTGAGSLSIETGTGSNAINAGALALGKTLTLTGSSAATISALGGNLNASSYSGALTITATGAGAQTITAGTGNASIADSTAGSSVTVNALAAPADDTLTVAGSASETVTNLAANLNASGETGALNVTTATGSMSIAIGSGANTINAAALGVDDLLTLTGSSAATLNNLTGDLDARGDTGALTITATGAGVSQDISLGAGATSVSDSAAGGTVTVNAAGLAAGATLTLAGSDAETVLNLVGDIVATSLAGALNVTTGAGSLSIATGHGATTIDAGALGAGDTLTLSGAAAAAISSLNGNLDAFGYTGALSVNVTGSGPQTIMTGTGAETIDAFLGGDTFDAGGGTDKFDVLGHSVSDTFTLAPDFGKDTITGFLASGANHDVLDINIADFSYLNSTMTQAQDFAALLMNNAFGGSSSATITDSLGDTLTLAGVSKATLTANAADFVFT